MEDLQRNLGFGGTSDFGRLSTCGFLKKWSGSGAFYARGQRSFDSVE